MAKQLSEVGAEVEAWDLHRVVSRALIEFSTETLAAARRQSKRWMAVWVAMTLMVSVALAFAHAPLVAYAMPVVALFLATNTCPDG